MTPEPEDHAVEHLRDLLAHPGYKMLLNHAASEWGPKRTLDRCRLERAELMPQVIAVSDAIMHMLAWPVDEIERLEREKQKAKQKDREPLIRRRA